jgi:hypothetical protein
MQSKHADNITPLILCADREIRNQLREQKERETDEDRLRQTWRVKVSLNAVAKYPESLVRGSEETGKIGE